MGRIGRYVARHHVGLIALMLAVTGGTAYAAGVANNSVGSPQIKNGQVKAADLAKDAVLSTQIRDGQVKSADVADNGIASIDIKDGGVRSAELATGSVTGAKLAAGSVGSDKIADGAVGSATIVDGSIALADLDAGSVANVISRAGTVAADAAQHDVLTIPGMGTLRVNCSAPNTLGAFYSFSSTVSQRAQIFAHDPTDNAPQGTIGLTGTAGGLGVAGANSTVFEGIMWSFTPDKVLTIEFFLTQSGVDCIYRARATLDRNEP